MGGLCRRGLTLPGPDAVPVLIEKPGLLQKVHASAAWLAGEITAALTFGVWDFEPVKLLRRGVHKFGNPVRRPVLVALTLVDQEPVGLPRG